MTSDRAGEDALSKEDDRELFEEVDEALKALGIARTSEISPSLAEIERAITADEADDARSRRPAGS